jgi:hypothetical protein
MLVVYLSLFGARFLPLAKPSVAILTTISIMGAWWWMKSRHWQVISKYREYSAFRPSRSMPVIPQDT